MQPHYTCEPAQFIQAHSRYFGHVLVTPRKTAWLAWSCPNGSQALREDHATQWEKKV